MRVMLLHKLAESIPEGYVPPQKLIADVGKMVSDARDAPGAGASNVYRARPSVKVQPEPLRPA
jgi:hypothetical protein